MSERSKSGIEVFKRRQESARKRKARRGSVGATVPDERSDELGLDYADVTEFDRILLDKLVEGEVINP